MENAGKYICNHLSERVHEEKAIGACNCQFLNSNKLIELWNSREDIRQSFKSKFNWFAYCKKVGLIR